ncbi:MAG: hypothetical protein ABIZ70_08825 [Gemmatimonadales bacterium]
MSRKVWLLLAVVAVAGAAFWWLRGHNGATVSADPGTLSVTWKGRYRGTTVLPARLNWCPVNRTGVLEAISGDTGVAVVVYEENALTSGPHPAVMPGVTAVLPRPGASVVMRWPRDSSALLTFTSQSGLVDLRPSAKSVSGTVSIRLRATSGSDSLTLAGTFTDIPVTAMAVGCP